MKKTLALFMIFAMLLPGTVFAEDTAGDSWVAIEEAYIYAFPLVIMDATLVSATNTETAASEKAPINQFMHGAATIDAKYKTVVTPNVDTVYTQSWMNLAAEPLIYTMPEADRFFNVQLLDGWTNTVDVLTEPGIYAFAYEQWQGDLPDDVIRVDFPTQMAWFLSRCLLMNKEDMVNVKAIQDKMVMMPLSEYVSGKAYVPPLGSYREENDFVPINRVFSMNPAEFFGKANELMLTNPPAAADADILEKLATINVGPGMTFDTGILTGDVAARWQEMLTGLRSKLEIASLHFFVALGQWSYLGDPIGDFGTAYDYRALIAMAGLGANTLDVAMYTQTNMDETGASMNGAHVYQIHFETMPPVLGNGFWSLTAYGSDDFLIDNPLDRYAITSRSAFELNEDGSLDIIVSAVEPEKISNWLPVNEDDFHLYMRIYTPDMQAIKSWTAPTISMIQ